MSLVCWLPLNGDLHNQGCSNVSVTNTSATINTAGKIGSCYSFGTSKSYLKFDNMDFIHNFTECSVSLWIKILSWNTSYATYFQLGLGSTPWAHYIFGLLRNSSASTLCFTISNGSSATNAGCLTPALELNTWYHLTLSYTAGHCKIYVNGVETKDYSTTIVPNFAGITTGIIGACNNGNNYQTNCLINDFRIYDHCLSAAEVREISQGLVLHYKLNTLDIQSGTNLVTGVTAGGRTTVLTDGRIGVQTTGVNQDTYFRIDLSEDIVAGTSYLFTCDASGISNGQYWGFPLGAQGNSGVLPFKIYNGHNVYPFTANSTKSDGTAMDWGTKRLFMDDNYRGDWANQACFYNFQLIKIGASDTIIKTEDSSGYNHNGTITGDITLNSSTPRYSASSLFNGTERITTTTPGADIRTLSCWCKTTKDTNTSQIFVADSFSGMCISFYKNNVIGVFGTTRSTGSKSVLGTAYKAGEWNHIVVVKTGDTGTRDIYCNGIKLTPTTDDYWNSATGFFVGARNASNANPYYGYLSDVRAYVTPLDADAIRQLYEVGAKIDNKGNLHTFELIEEQNNIFSTIEFNRTLLQWGNGLGRYQQANNTTTLTEDGLRIYRPPNLTQANDGKTMWGGMKLINQSTDSIHPYDPAIDNIWGLQKNHTYLWAFHVKGQSSQASESIIINHNMGNGVSNGVGPNPTIIAGDRTIPANFQGEKDCYLIFTITDDLVKTSTKTGSGFTAEQSYLSYRHLQFYWGYGNTGELGTDIYVTNIRLYDITNHMAEFTKMGQAKFFDFIEQMNKCQVRKNSELLATEFIEL